VPVPEVRWDGGVRSLAAGQERADGPLVVLLPGLGALGYLVDTLAACGGWARSYLLDVPGFGHRPPRPCPPEVPAIAATVSRWLDLVDGDLPVVLVGHSTAAQAALHVAAERPDRVRALVAMGLTFPPEQRRFPPLARAALRDLPRENVGLVPAVLPYYLRGGADLVRMVRSGQQDRPEEVIEAVRCPTLLVRGVHDTFAHQEWIDRLTAAAPDGWSVTAPGAHTFPFGRGELTAELIARAAHRAGLTSGTA
jgi:pimeloyl-ACP methyl ester carboxylesterase